MILKKLLNPNHPFSPAKCPFYYGWIIMIGATLGTIASIPGHTMGMGVFTEYLITSLGITRNSLAQSYAIGTIVSSMCLPWAGVMLDRLGARPMIVLACWGLGIALIFMGLLEVFVRNILPAGASPWVLFVVMTCVFFCTRFFGQGALTMVSRSMVGRWFNSRRSFVTMISSLGVGLSFNIAPKVLNQSLEVFGGQGTIFLMAAIIGLGMGTVGYLIFRNTPEECGLLLENGIERKKKHRQDIQTYHEFTRKEAVKTYPFWAVTLCFAWYSLTITALTFHISDIGREFGYSRDYVYNIFAYSAIVGICATLFTGWAGDRLPMKILVLMIAIGQYMISLGVVYFQTGIGFNTIAIGYGMSNGVFMSLITMVWPRFFGRKHLGAVSGACTLFVVFASAFGPILISELHLFFGNYSQPFMLVSLVQGILIITSLFVENPQRLHRRKTA